MKYAFYFVIAVILLPCTSFSQQTAIDTIREPMLYLKDGTILRSDEFEMKKPLHSDVKFFRNGEKMDISEVKFYQSTKNLFVPYEGDLAARIDKGALDLYLFNDYIYFYDEVRRHAKRVKVYLFIRGLDDLKLATYDNLKTEFSTFPNNNYPKEEKIILHLLEKGKKRNKTKNTMLWSGLGAMLMGALCSELATERDDSGIFHTKNEAVSATGIIIFTAGFGVALTGYNLRKENEFYAKAIKHYNKFY